MLFESSIIALPLLAVLSVSSPLDGILKSFEKIKMSISEFWIIVIASGLVSIFKGVKSSSEPQENADNRTNKNRSRGQGQHR